VKQLNREWAFHSSIPILAVKASFVVESHDTGGYMKATYIEVDFVDNLRQYRVVYICISAKIIRQGKFEVSRCYLAWLVNVKVAKGALQFHIFK